MINVEISPLCNYVDKRMDLSMGNYGVKRRELTPFGILVEE